MRSNRRVVKNLKAKAKKRKRCRRVREEIKGRVSRGVKRF
jgi:hypothetical protein